MEALRLRSQPQSCATSDVSRLWASDEGGTCFVASASAKYEIARENVLVAGAPLGHPAKGYILRTLSRASSTDGNFLEPPPLPNWGIIVRRMRAQLAAMVPYAGCVASLGRRLQPLLFRQGCEALLRMSFEEQARGECRPTGRQDVAAVVAWIVG